MTLEHKRYYEALDSGDFAAKWIILTPNKDHINADQCPQNIITL